MRLITLSTESGSRAAVQRGKAALLIPTLDGGAPPGDVGALLKAGPAGLEAARRVPRNGGEELPLQADIVLPAVCRKIDYEGELGVVIGTAGAEISTELAWDHVAGLTVVNEVSIRDFQNRTTQWFAGKNVQASTPFGPAVTTLDEIDEVPALELRVTVNGEERQRALLGDLVFDIPSLIADLSQIVELEPGDVIATGTPGGVGAATETFLNDGDVVEVSIDMLGSIRNTFRVEPVG
jgi:acylpyruvate hydrolase